MPDGAKVKSLHISKLSALRQGARAKAKSLHISKLSALSEAPAQKARARVETAERRPSSYASGTTETNTFAETPSISRISTV